MALSILEQMSPASLLETIIQEDVKALSSLHGIGAKKAEQLILQLKNVEPKILSKNTPNYSKWPGKIMA